MLFENDSSYRGSKRREYRLEEENRRGRTGTGDSREDDGDAYSSRRAREGQKNTFNTNHKMPMLQIDDDFSYISDEDDRSRGEEDEEYDVDRNPGNFSTSRRNRSSGGSSRRGGGNSSTNRYTNRREYNRHGGDSDRSEVDEDNEDVGGDDDYDRRYRGGSRDDSYTNRRSGEPPAAVRSSRNDSRRGREMDRVADRRLRDEVEDDGDSGGGRVLDGRDARNNRRERMSYEDEHQDHEYSAVEDDQSVIISSGHQAPGHSTEHFNSGGVPPSFVHVAHESGGRTEHVQCVIVRESRGIKSRLTPTYHLLLEEKNKHLITAVKRTYNRTSNYHMFDMTRGVVGRRLSKKSGNYLGKLRALNMSRTEYALITMSSEREEVAAIVFNRHTLINQIKDGSVPRKMSVMVPQLDADSIPVPNRVSETGHGSMVDMLHAMDNGNMFVFESKDPVFENGNYRLNFHGRVSIPSVKNFQLVSVDDPNHIICQFGKVAEERFNLDFKAPLNAFQAFALALCQFNL